MPGNRCRGSKVSHKTFHFAWPTRGENGLAWLDLTSTSTGRVYASRFDSSETVATVTAISNASETKRNSTFEIREFRGFQKGGPAMSVEITENNGTIDARAGGQTPSATPVKYSFTIGGKRIPPATPAIFQLIYRLLSRCLFHCSLNATVNPGQKLATVSHGRSIFFFSTPVSPIS